MKRFLYKKITSFKGTYLGEVLKSWARTITHALENKDNNLNSNGEFWLIAAINKSSLNINVVFDVGANVGIWSKRVLDVHPNVQIYSFEPVPDTFLKLKTQLGSFSNVELNNLALSDFTGKMNINYYPESSYFSSVYSHPLTDAEPEVREIEGTTGDAFCKEKGIERIDFLKIDTEGSEPKVLEGFKEMVKQQKVRMIQFEYGEMNIGNRFLLRDFYVFFAQNGYVVGKIFPDHVDFSPYQIEKENFIISNFLAVLESETKLINMLSSKKG